MPIFLSSLCIFVLLGAIIGSLLAASPVIQNSNRTISNLPFLVIAFGVIASISFCYAAPIAFGLTWSLLIMQPVVISALFAFSFVVILHYLSILKLPEKLVRQSRIKNAPAIGVLLGVLAFCSIAPINANLFAYWDMLTIPKQLGAIIATGTGIALPFLTIKNKSIAKTIFRFCHRFESAHYFAGFVLMVLMVASFAVFTKEPLNSFFVATLSVFLFLAFGCWATSLLFDRNRQPYKAILTGTAIAFSGSLLSLTVFVPSIYELDWRTFSETKLANLQKQGRIVFIDFTGPN